MGVPNLLKLLREITTSQTLSAYRGKRAGIDGYTWLHRSLYCIGDGILKNPIDITRCINFFIKKLRLLLRNQITPIFVFDGDKLPMKNNEEDKRLLKRKEYERESENMLKMNNIYGAINKKIESFDVTPEFTYYFIKILNIYNIEYYVAPYEADAQLAYLSYINYVDFIITEDSDLIAYGCKCVLFKLGFLKNQPPDVGEEILYENIKECKELKFNNFSQDKFLNFCILMGCDYIKIQRVGPKLSNEAVNKYDDYNKFLGYIFNKNCTKGSISETIKQYEKAFLTFRYQVVYCPREKKMRYFHDINEKRYYFLEKYRNDLNFLGNTELNVNIDEYIKGYINPITKKKIDENCDKYYVDKSVYDIAKGTNYSKRNEDNDEQNDDINYNYYDYQIESGRFLSQFNFFPKMGKYKPKKQKKNEKPKNQCDIESFLGGNNKLKKIHTNKSNNNIINNNPKKDNNENINNNEDESNNGDNDENKVNLSIFDKYILDIKNSSNKREYNDLDIVKNNNRSKDCANSSLHLSEADLNSCFNPLTQYPKTKMRSSIGSKQKKLYNKFKLKFQDESEKKDNKEKDKDIGIELLDNYGFSETNYNSNKEIFTNPYLSNEIKNDKKILSKAFKDINKENLMPKKDEEKLIYIGDDESSVENNEIKFVNEDKKEKDEFSKISGFNLDDYKNTFFDLDKF